MKSEINDAKATLIRQINWLEYNLHVGARLIRSFDGKRLTPSIGAAIQRVQRAAAIDRQQLRLLNAALQRLIDKEAILNELTNTKDALTK